MQDKKYKFALIGCGRIAVRHSELLGGNQIRGAELSAVCDIDQSKAKSLGEKYDVPWYTDYHELAKNIDTDFFVILSESGKHSQHVIELSKYKKNILVEKPMALTLSDADKMIQSCDENGIKLFVIKQNRFNLPVMKLKEAIDEGRFGKLILGTVRVRWCRPQEYYNQDSWRGTWKDDGGVITNQASHHIDLLEWLMGDVESVFTMNDTFLVDIEADDTSISTLRFKSGALGVIEATTATRPNDLEGSISILGEKGSVVIGGFAVNKIITWNFHEQKKEDEDVINNFSQNPPDVYGFGHKSYYEHVIDCVENNKKQLIDGLEGRKSLELINAMYESSEIQKKVFLNFNPHVTKLGL